MNLKQKIGQAFWNLGDRLVLGYDGGDSNRMRKDLGWGRATPYDEDSLVKDNTLQLLRQKGADLRRNNAVVSGVCNRLALFTVGATGIIPQAKTEDAAWNRAAEQWWNEVYSFACDSRKRSSLYDFQNMAVSCRPVQGGIYFQKKEDGTIRPVECERIRNPQDVKKSKLWTDGIRVNKQTGQIEMFCVHSRDNDGTFSMKHLEEDVLAENFIRVTTPPWRIDQVREVPDFAPIITTLQDIHEMNKYTLNTAKWQSMILGFLKKQAGSGLNSFVRGSSNPAVTSRQTFKFDWGEILEGLPGDELDMASSTTPNNTHIPYVKLQLALCASSLSMPYEFFTLDLAGLDFSRQKGMFLLVNFACRPWKRWLIDSFLRPLWNWRIAMEMRPGGALAPAPATNGISEWMKVDWQCPEEPWIDRQEAQQADVLEIQAGLNTLGRASKRRGNDLEDTLREKAQEQKLIEQIAGEYGVDPEKLVKMQIPGQTEKNTLQKDDAEAETEEETKEKKPTEYKEGNKWLT